jgi:hypothetical protein
MQCNLAGTLSRSRARNIEFFNLKLVPSLRALLSVSRVVMASRADMVPKRMGICQAGRNSLAVTTGQGHTRLGCSMQEGGELSMF